jgi:hypothetical protein
MPKPRPLNATLRARLARIEAEIAREEPARAWLREIGPTVREIKTGLEALDEEIASSVLLCCDRGWLCQHLGELLDACQWASESTVQELSSEARKKSIKDSVFATAATELVEDLPVRLTRAAKREFASRLGSLERMCASYKKLKENSSKRGRGRPADLALRRLLEGLIGVYEDFTDKKPGTSVSGLDGTVGGPLVHFLATCLRLHGINKSLPALRSLIRSTDRYKEAHR